MLTIDTFTKDELKLIKDAKRNSPNYGGLYLKLFLPLSFILGLLGFIFHHPYWEVVLIFASGFLIAAAYLTLKPKYHFAKDLKEKIKYIGTVKVLGKSNKENDWKLHLDAREIKHLSLDREKIFNEIEVGNELYLEIAKNSLLIFRLKKGNVWLFRSL